MSQRAPNICDGYEYLSSCLSTVGTALEMSDYNEWAYTKSAQPSAIHTHTHGPHIALTFDYTPVTITVICAVCRTMPDKRHCQRTREAQLGHISAATVINSSICNLSVILYHIVGIVPFISSYCMRMDMLARQFLRDLNFVMDVMTRQPQFSAPYT